MIEIATQDVERVEQMLAGIPGGAESALKTAISKGQSTARQETASGITETYLISKSNLRIAENVKVQTKATNNAVVGLVKYSGTKLPLYRYDISHKYPSNGKQRKMVSARKLIKSTRESFPYAFIAQTKTGHLGIFERTTVRGYPIKEVMGDSYPQMAASPDVMDNVETKTSEMVQSEIGNAITKELDKFGG